MKKNDIPDWFFKGDELPTKEEVGVGISMSRRDFKKLKKEVSSPTENSITAGKRREGLPPTAPSGGFK